MYSKYFSLLRSDFDIFHPYDVFMLECDFLFIYFSKLMRNINFDYS